jgi:tRNA modification GTPase
LPPRLEQIVVHNKIDLAGMPPKIETRAAQQDVDAVTRHVFLSAKTGEGVGLLRQAILECAGAHGDMEGAFLARERHVAALRKAARHVAAAATHLDVRTPALELVAEELRGAQVALAQVTGEFTSDDLLGAIFARFCIGK